MPKYELQMKLLQSHTHKKKTVGHSFVQFADPAEVRWLVWCSAQETDVGLLCWEVKAAICTMKDSYMYMYMCGVCTCTCALYVCICIQYMCTWACVYLYTTLFHC